MYFGATAEADTAKVSGIGFCWVRGSITEQQACQVGSAKTELMPGK
jgi:hypothetical protein